MCSSLPTNATTKYYVVHHSFISLFHQSSFLSKHRNQTHIFPSTFFPSPLHHHHLHLLIFFSSPSFCFLINPTMLLLLFHLLPPSFSFYPLAPPLVIISSAPHSTFPLPPNAMPLPTHSLTSNQSDHSHCHLSETFSLGEGKEEAGSRRERQKE